MSVSGIFGHSGVTVSFGERFAMSDQFDTIFGEGMELVETTAEYLDGQGREDAKRLVPPVSIAYATESMRLTTRLLDLASWLLIQRSLKDGEITLEEALAKREGMALRPFGRVDHVKHFEELPEGLKQLIRRCYAFGERINQIDLSMRSSAVDKPALHHNPVNDQLRRLEAEIIAMPRAS